MNMRKMSVLSACAAGTLGFAVGASADSEYLNVTYLHNGPADAVWIDYVDGEAWDSAARTGGIHAYAGNLNFSGGLNAFCFELMGALDSGDVIQYKHQDLNDFNPRANFIRKHYSANYAGLSGNDDYAAFQMIIWEIMDEDWDTSDTNQLNIHLGAVQFNNLTTGAEAAVTAQLANLPYGGYQTGLDVWTNADYQDIITIVPGPSVALAGMIGLAGIRRRRRN